MAIIIKVELWPGGDERRARLIGTAELANVSGGRFGDYVFDLMEEASPPVARATNCRGRIRNYDRSQSVWRLVSAMLNIVFRETSFNKARGGHARAAALSKARRVEIARQAAEARWRKPNG